MNPAKLDAIDAAIIDLLQQDGRMPASEIACQVEGATERMVRYRIERLRQKGVINITAVVDPRAIGYSVAADVMIEVESGAIPDVVRRVVELDCVTYASAVTGERDVSIQCVARSLDELHTFVFNVLQKIPGIRRTHTFTVPHPAKYIYNWKVPREVYCPEEQEEGG